MINLNLISIAFGACFLAMWLMDACLNSVLAKRIGDPKSHYYIPFYSYFRFGVLTGIHPIVVFIGLATSILATEWYDISLAPQYVILITLISIVINAAIIELAAVSLKKSKWRYASGTVFCGLISVCSYLPILLLAQYTGSHFVFVCLLLIQAVFLQLPKIILSITSSNLKRTDNC
jgi:hypothetical protein